MVFVRFLLFYTIVLLGHLPRLAGRIFWSVLSCSPAVTLSKHAQDATLKLNEFFKNCQHFDDPRVPLQGLPRNYEQNGGNETEKATLESENRINCESNSLLLMPVWLDLPSPFRNVFGGPFGAVCLFSF